MGGAEAGSGPGHGRCRLAPCVAWPLTTGWRHALQHSCSTTAGFFCRGLCCGEFNSPQGMVPCVRHCTCLEMFTICPAVPFNLETSWTAVCGVTLCILPVAGQAAWQSRLTTQQPGSACQVVLVLPPVTPLTCKAASAIRALDTEGICCKAMRSGVCQWLLYKQLQGQYSAVVGLGGAAGM